MSDGKSSKNHEDIEPPKDKQKNYIDKWLGGLAGSAAEAFRGRKSKLDEDIEESGG